MKFTRMTKGKPAQGTDEKSLGSLLLAVCFVKANVAETREPRRKESYLNSITNE